VQSGKKFIIFGNVQGAFHSLVRDLNRLKEWNVIDDNFVIKDKQYYIVFNGKAVDRSPYNLETLLILFNLLYANPDQVIYVRGYDECGKWIDYDLKTELQIRMGINFAYDIPLKKEIDAFFNTLPLALYVKYGSGSAAQFMCFSQLKDTGSPLDKNNYSNFLMQDSDGIHHIVDNDIRQPEVNLLAIFKEGTIGRELFYEKGISFVIPANGFAHWDLLSCPTEPYKDVLTQDSFVVMDTQADMCSWTIMHYTQDAHKQEPLKVTVYDFLTASKLYTTQSNWGQKSKLLLTKDIFSLSDNKTKVPAFYVGATMDFSVNMQISLGVFEGFSTRINQENVRGAGKKQVLKFLFLNDRHSVSRSYNNTLKMLQKGIDTQVMLIGAQSFIGVKPLIEAEKLILLFPDAGIAAAREKTLTNTVHLMAAYGDEVPILIQQALDILKLKKIAIFYQDDAFGKENLSIAEKIFKQRGFTNYFAVSYKRGSADVKANAQKVNLFEPDAILFFSTALSAISFINAMELTKINNMYLGGVHPLAIAEFENFLRYKGLEMSLTNIVPNPIDTRLPIVVAYQSALREQGYFKFSAYSLLGYINATLLIEVLKKIRGPITKEKIITGFESFKNFDLGGIFLDFDLNTRSLGNHVWLSSGGTWQHFDRRHKGKKIKK
jgi:branched-chain amino acid transport system substrate-binding protein